MFSGRLPRGMYSNQILIPENAEAGAPPGLAAGFLDANNMERYELTSEQELTIPKR